MVAFLSSCLTALIVIARSSRGCRRFVGLTELSPQPLQPVQESLPSRFNRMVAHDVSPLTHAVSAQRRSRATHGQCAPFPRKPPNLRMSAGALTPMYLRKARQAFTVGVESAHSGPLGSSGLARSVTPARLPPAESANGRGDRKRVRDVAYVRAGGVLTPGKSYVVEPLESQLAAAAGG